jgi:hypothetical protein
LEALDSVGGAVVQFVIKNQRTREEYWELNKSSSLALRVVIPSDKPATMAVFVALLRCSIGRV